MKRFTILAAVLIVAAGVLTAAVEEEWAVVYSSRLTGVDGKAVEPDLYMMTFGIYNAEEGGERLWEARQLVDVKSGGYYTVYLAPIPGTVFSGQGESSEGPDRWLQAQPDGGDPIKPRSRIGYKSGEYAATATTTDKTAAPYPAYHDTTSDTIIFKYNSLDSAVTKLSAEVGELKQVNNDLKAQVSKLQQRIDSLEGMNK